MSDSFNIERKRLVATYAVSLAILLLLSASIEAIYNPHFSLPGLLVRVAVEILLLSIGFAYAYRLLKGINAGHSRLHNRDARYQQVLDNMMEGIQVMNSNMEYLYLNDAAVAQSRYTRKELLGKRFTDMYLGVEHTELFRQMEACMKEQRVVSIENDFTFPTGDVRHFELCMEPIPEGIFILSLDVTDKKKREKERKERMEETQQILFRISHEVRQPVTGILGLSELLNENELSPNDVRSYTCMMRESVQAMDKYTRELTNYVSSLSLSV